MNSMPPPSPGKIVLPPPPTVKSELTKPNRTQSTSPSRTYSRGRERNIKNGTPTTMNVPPVGSPVTMAQSPVHTTHGTQTFTTRSTTPNNASAPRKKRIPSPPAMVRNNNNNSNNNNVGVARPESFQRTHSGSKAGASSHTHPVVPVVVLSPEGSQRPASPTNVDIRSRLEMMIPLDMTCGDLSFGLAKALGVPPADVEIVSALHGVIATEFRLRQPHPPICSSSDLHDAMKANAGIIRATLTQAMRRSTVATLWPELLQEMQSLRFKVEKLQQQDAGKDEIMYDPTSFGGGVGSGKRNMIHSVPIEGEMKAQHLRSMQHAKLVDEYSLLRQELEEKKVLLERNRAESNAFKMQIAELQAKYNIAMRDMDAAVQKGKMENGEQLALLEVTLKENDEYRKLLAEQSSRITRLQKELKVAQDKAKSSGPQANKEEVLQPILVTETVSSPKSTK